MSGPTDNGAETRRAILDALARRNGGAHKRELCRMTGRGWGTISHHVYTLAKANLVATEVHGRQLWVFLPEVRRGQRDWLVVTGTPQRRRLLEVLRRRPPATINALSDEMEVSRKVIRTHLQNLQRYGAVEATDEYPPKYLHVDRKKGRLP